MRFPLLYALISAIAAPTFVIAAESEKTVCTRCCAKCVQGDMGTSDPMAPNRFQGPKGGDTRRMPPVPLLPGHFVTSTDDTHGLKIGPKGGITRRSRYATVAETALPVTVMCSTCKMTCAQ